MLHDTIKMILEDPEKVYQEMMENNAEFRKFVEENKDKTAEEIIEEYHVII